MISSVLVCSAVMAQAPPDSQPKNGEKGVVTTTAATESGGEVKAVTQAILDEIDKRSELMANIEYLCDMIGPRLTGSPNLTKANQWTETSSSSTGSSNAHLESWTIDRAWTRGEAKGRVVVAGRAADPARVVGLEPLDRRSQARAGGPREGPVHR